LSNLSYESKYLILKVSICETGLPVVGVVGSVAVVVGSVVVVVGSVVVVVVAVVVVVKLLTDV